VGWKYLHAAALPAWLNAVAASMWHTHAHTRAHKHTCAHTHTRTHTHTHAAPGQPKVAQLEMPGARVQQVAHLDVPVHHPALVAVVYGCQQLPHQALHLQGMRGASWQGHAARYVRTHTHAHIPTHERARVAGQGELHG